MKNKGLSLLLLLLGGAAVYYFYKNGKKKYKGSVIVDPLDKGEFVPDVASSVQEVVMQLNSNENVTMPIVEQIREVSKPKEIESYQSFYGTTISGKKVGVPYSI
jgi:hypothetical protein